MLINQAPAAGLDDNTPWDALYEQAADQCNDFVSQVRTVTAHDPEDSVDLVCAAAETTGASVQALSGPWSLYTPQDAATVASALFVQLQYSADALQELACAVGRIVERGEAELPAQAGAGQPTNLSDALETLRSVSDTIHGLAAQHASTTVRALHAAPSSAPMPADAHQTVEAVAALLTQQHDGAVTLNTRHEDGAYQDDPDDNYGCGCDVTIVSGDEEYNFHRGDSEWSVTRESDGRKRSDGATVYNAWETLGTTSRTAHPQQLTDDILRVMAADRT
ncbi:hypothetical protein ACFVH0_21345 [Streptomyces sp. NPDC127117]|uniref:hypothetical protein n=1 Tax=Streptomyces sp. NPDC127117 TaxID=3345368 RepID=UPI00364214E4